MNCKRWDLAKIIVGKHSGREVFIIDPTKAPHVHVSGLPSWYVELQGDPVPCTAPDGSKVPSIHFHVPDAWLETIESFWVGTKWAK
ncbi:hypothetical protein [Burkholderia glumae]